MAKSFMYRLVGLGKIPRPLMAQLNSEGIILMDEGIKGSVTYIDFSAPGRYSSWRRQWYTSSIALTELRLVALRYSQPIIDVPLADERLGRMRFSLEGSTLPLCTQGSESYGHFDFSSTQCPRPPAPTGTTCCNPTPGYINPVLLSN